MARAQIDESEGQNIPQALPRKAPYWRVAALLPALLLALMPALLLAPLAGCDRSPPRSAAPAATGTAAAPFPELADVARVVADARAILPRVPAEAAPVALAPGRMPAVPEPRLVLVGEARLLRPNSFPELTPRLQVEVLLDERMPPGGALRVTDGRGTNTWAVLDSYAQGSREGAFAYTLRVADATARLRYLALLGVPYEAGGRQYRAFEGYLLAPNAQGALATNGPLYAVDFGYRHAEPPEPVLAAQALAARIEALRARSEETARLGGRLAELERASQRLRTTAVPPEQQARQRADLQDFAQRIATTHAEHGQALSALRAGLLAVYRQRVALAEDWATFVESNGWRWRTPAERRTVYVPLQALRASYPQLESIHAAVGPDADPELRQARQAMQQALLREQERAPLGQ